MPTHTSLKGVSDVSQSLISDELEANLIGFFQWSLLGAGGFFTVTVPETGPFGGDQSQLRPVTDPNFIDGQVWEAFRKDWVWESGVENANQPVRVSGVYVGGDFFPYASGMVVDYPNGRVILNEPISQSSVVQCEYSYRLFQLYSCDNPVWMDVQTYSWRNDNSQFLQVGSGAWDTLAQNRVQMPAMFVEAVPDAKRYGLMLGGGMVVKQSVMFHILAEERWHAKWLHDAVCMQYQKRLNGFDKNLLLTADAFPLDASGQPKGNALMYPDLVKPTGDGGQFYWDQIRFDQTQGVPQPRLGNLWYASVRCTMEVDRPG